MGCQQFDRELDLRGIILNRVAGARQEALIRDSVEKYCALPVLGSIPKLKNNLFPERHMGLVPHQERSHAEQAIAWARSIVEEHIDLDVLIQCSHAVDPIEIPSQTDMNPIDETGKEVTSGHGRDKAPRIGFIRDKAFWFYYPENLNELKKRGAELIPISATEDPTLPDLDALYIGGGFPEIQATALAENESFRKDLQGAIEMGLPVYAECGGLMYLGDHLRVNENAYPMVGAFPIDFQLRKKPQGHGYTVMEVMEDNLFYSKGEILKGHEFHYSKPLVHDKVELRTMFKVRRGFGLDGTRDGLYKNNLMGTYTHIHAGGYPKWIERLFRVAQRFQQRDRTDFFKRF
jgi:cobyrinic acid a,c-diamide synthase